MAASTLDQLSSFLGSGEPDLRVAAARVLGELKAKSPGVISGLVSMLETGEPVLQRSALFALARIGTDRATAAVLPLLAAKDEAVRAAAVEALVAGGEGVIPDLRKRLDDADPKLGRAIESVLARFSGKDAFTAFLEGLDHADAQGARAAALEMRVQIKAADARTRKGYTSAVLKFLTDHEKRRATGEVSDDAVAAAIKLLGYLEDPRSHEALLAYARTGSAMLRQEALIALRFALADEAAAPEIIDALIDAAIGEDETLAQAALITLSTVELGARSAKKVVELVTHPKTDRARFAIDQLQRQKGKVATRVLVEVVATAEDRTRAEMAARALERREDIAEPLAEALLATKDADRAWLLRRTFRAIAPGLPAKLKAELVARAAEEVIGGQVEATAWFEAARDADPDGLAEALRQGFAKLKRSKKLDEAEAVLGVLAKMRNASDQDRYQLALLALARSKKDTKPAARAADPALEQLGHLAKHGFDVARALSKEKGLELEDLFYVGFHFAEIGDGAGEALLEHIAEAAGRKKIGKLAKNKLALIARQ